MGHILPYKRPYNLPYTSSVFNTDYSFYHLMKRDTVWLGVPSDIYGDDATLRDDYGNNASLQEYGSNGVGWLIGRNAIRFNGSSDYITYPASLLSALDPNTFSFSAWLRLPTYSATSTLLHVTDNTNTLTIKHTASNEITIARTGGTSVVLSSVPEHEDVVFAVTKTGNTVTGFVANASTTITDNETDHSTSFSTSTIIRTGYDGTIYSTIELSYHAFYNTALTQTNIEAIYSDMYSAPAILATLNDQGSNVATAEYIGSTANIDITDVGVADYHAQVTINALTSGTTSFLFRLSQDESDYVELLFTASGTAIEINESGGSALISTTYSADDVFDVYLYGARVTLYKNGSQVGTDTLSDDIFSARFKVTHGTGSDFDIALYDVYGQAISILASFETAWMLEDVSETTAFSSLKRTLITIILRYISDARALSSVSYVDALEALNEMATTESETLINFADRRDSLAVKINGLLDYINPTFIWDEVDSVFYWAGASKVIGDATDNGDTSYTVNDGTWWSANNTVLVEYELADGASPNGNLFSWTNASNQRYEYGSFNDGERLYINPPGQYVYPANTGVNSGEQSGRRRLLNAVNASVNSVGKLDANVALDNAIQAGAFVAPTKVGIRYNARFGGTIETVATFHRAIAWNRKMTSAQLHGNMRNGNYPPIHLIGDSALNTGSQLEEIALLCTDDYIAFSQDGVGGSTLEDQATRFDSDSLHWTSTLVIIDIGLSDTQANALVAIADMVANLARPNWFYVEPNYVDSAILDAIADYAGTHYIPTRSLMQTANDGSPEDLEDVANGILPRSLRIDAVHLNTAGMTVYAGIIHDYISAQGLMP